MIVEDKEFDRIKTVFSSHLSTSFLVLDSEEKNSVAFVMVPRFCCSLMGGFSPSFI